jgi:hypothetical protein
VGLSAIIGIYLIHQIWVWHPFFRFYQGVGTRALLKLAATTALCQPFGPDEGRIAAVGGVLMIVEPLHAGLRRLTSAFPPPGPTVNQRLPFAERVAAARAFVAGILPEKSVMPQSPEPVRAIHRRVAGSHTMEQVGAALDGLAAKGSIQRIDGKAGPAYAKLPLVLGMYEMQVNRLTAGLERDVRAYFDEAFAGRALFATRTPQMRTVPVNKSIPVGHAVASYDDVRRFVEQSPGPFAALNCVCRQGKDLTGEPIVRFPRSHGGQGPGRRPDVNIQEFGRHHSHYGRESVILKRNSGETKRVVEKVERENRAQPQQKHDLKPFFADSFVQCCEFRVTSNPAGDPVARKGATHQEGCARAHTCANPNCDHAQRDTEHETGSQ